MNKCTLTKKRIAIVTHSFFDVGGAENNTQNIVRELLKLKYKVTIFVPKDSIKKIKGKKIEIVPLPDSIFNIQFRNIILDWKNKYFVSRTIRKLKFDHVHFSMIKAPLALFPFFYHHNFSIACRDLEIFDPVRHGYKKIYQKYKNYINYKGTRTSFLGNLFTILFFWFYKKKAKFITISDSMSLELKTFKIPNERIFKIVNGIDSSRFKKIIKSTTIKKNKNTFYILSVGRNDSRKGFIFLIEAAEKLIKKKILDFKFIIKGRGFEKYLELIKKRNLSDFFCIYDLSFNIDFHIKRNFFDFYLPDVKTVSLYKIADLVIIPSILESLSNIGLETEVSGKPLIVSDSVGCNEYIKRGTAIGFEQANTDDLVEKIIFLRKNKNIKEQLKRRRKFWSFKSDIKNSTEKYLNVFFNKI